MSMMALPMMMLGLATPAGMALPQAQSPRLRNPETMITYAEYPGEALQRGESGIVSVLLRVSAEGRATSCEVTETSGSANLDSRSCALLISRARFDPAKDAAGKAIPGEYRAANSWGVGARQPTTNISLTLQVSRLPRDVRSPVKARLVFGPSGQVTACEIMTSSGSAEADRVSCAYIKAQTTMPAPRSASGAVPAAAVRYVAVNFSVEAAK